MASSTTDKPTIPADKTKPEADGKSHGEAITKAGAALAQPDSKIPLSAGSTAAIDGDRPPTITGTPTTTGDTKPTASDATQTRAEGSGFFGKTVGYLKDLILGSSKPIDSDSLSKVFLAKWSSDSKEDREMRAYLGRRAETPPEALTTLSKDADPDVRAAVAGNPKTPEKVLSSLAKDTDEAVVRAVLGNPSSSQTTKDRIVSKMTAGFGDIEKAKAAAKDSNTPPEVLSSLASLKDRETRHGVAANPSSSAETLNKLSTDGDSWVRTGVAANQSTPPETLKEMSKDRDPMVLDYLAKNSSTPIETLQQLSGGVNADRYGSESNDTLRYRKQDAIRTMWKMAEDPNTTPAKLEQLSGNRDPLTLEALAKNANTPAAGLAKVVETSQSFYYGDKGSSIRLAVAENENTSVQTLMKLASDPRYTVVHPALDHIAKIADDPAVTQDTLNELAQSKDAQVLQRVAHSKSASPELLTKLSETFRNVRTAVAENPSTPPELLEKLSRDDSKDSREGVARNSASTPEMRARLAEDPEESVRAALAGNKITEPAILAKLSTDSSDLVRATAGYNPSTSPETLATLAVDKDKSVRDAVLSNPSTAEETRNKIVQAEAEITRQTELAQKNTTSPTELADLAKSEDWRVRAAVAGNTLTPPATLSALAADERGAVRSAVASNDSTPGEALQLLADRPSQTGSDLATKRAALRNKNMPVETLEKIANESLSGDRRQDFYLDSIAANPSTPPQLLTKLASEGDWIRKNVAANTSTPPTILAMLANDKSTDVQTSVAGNKSTDKDTLTKMTFRYDTSDSVKFSLAGNSSTPPAALDQLGKSQIAELREAVASNPSTSHETLIKLAADDSEANIRLAAAKNLSKGSSAGAGTDAQSAPEPEATKDKAAPSTEKATAAEAPASGEDLDQLGINVTDQSGMKAVTVEGIQQRMTARLDQMNTAHEIADRIHDPEALRRELGITNDEVKALEPADRARLADDLKGKLAAYGIAADLLPDLVSYVFHLAG